MCRCLRGTLGIIMVEKNHMIRQCIESDFETIYKIINDAAKAYQGVIPNDRWHDPYMSRDELSQEIQDGIIFWGSEKDGLLAGVMGIQDKGNATLIRHAYVRTMVRNQGIGTTLVRYLETATNKPVLVGTWRAATWAISFYQKNGYQLMAFKLEDLEEIEDYDTENHSRVSRGSTDPTKFLHQIIEYLPHAIPFGCRLDVWNRQVIDHHSFSPI